MRIYLIVSTVLFIVIIAILYYPNYERVYHENQLELIEVKLEGAVKNEGVYLVPNDITIGKLIELAGGLKADADISSINYYQKIESGTYVIKKVKVEEELEKGSGLIKYDLNTVTYEQLLTIPNITENRALNIIIYRRDNKAFYQVEELLNVSGIGSVTYDKIKDYFYI